MKNKWPLIILLLIIVGYLVFPLIKLTFTGLKLAKNSSQTLKSATIYAQNLFSSDQEEQRSYSEKLKIDLKITGDTLNSFINQSQKSRLAKLFINDRFKQLNTAQELIPAAEKLLAGNHTHILLFQNSEELRATGGFLGSYAKLELSDGVLKTFEIQDIYVPDGQFNWFIEAPAGAKEYLSGGDGLRLRDANWHPDFPTSAQQILTYMAWGKEAGIDGVVAINLPIIEKILTITGPIFIPDYNQTVTDKNFADIARADRSNFFPGSVTKKHFLSTFFNQLVFKLQSLDQSQQRQLVEEMITSALHKDITFFSHDDELQNIFENLNVSGQLIKAENTLSLMLVESNVGINKANQHLDRAVDLQIKEKSSLVSVTFTNHNFPPPTQQKKANEANHLGYVNYQRIVLPAVVEARNLVFDDLIIESWNEELITNSKGESFRQVGFLVTIPEQTTKKLSFEIDHPTFGELNKIFIQKQAGLPPTLYSISHQDFQQSFELNKDTLVEFTP
jgi:hypothetical protein